MAASWLWVALMTKDGAGRHLGDGDDATTDPANGDRGEVDDMVAADGVRIFLSTGSLILQV